MWQSRHSEVNVYFLELSEQTGWLSTLGIEIPRIDDEDLNSSTESTNSTSLIHCIACVGNCEQVHTSVLNLIFQQENVAGLGNLSK